MDQTLERAVLFGNVEAARKCLEAGADVNAGNDNGISPLMCATVKGDAAMVRLLLKFGAETRVTAQRVPASGLAQAHPDVRAILLEAEGAELRDAAKRGDTKAVAAALDAGRAVDQTGDMDRTALAIAAEEGHEDVVRLLLDRGAAVDARDRVGRTPLMVAAAKGHAAVVRLMLDRGADPEARNQWDQTPLVLAARGKHRDVVDLLANGAEIGLVNHISLGDVERAGEMLADGADPNAAAPDGTTPLIAAASTGSVDFMRALLERGAAVNPVNSAGASALTIAVLAAHRPAVELLLQNGADENPSGGEDFGPLQSAVTGRNLALVRLLLDHGADVNARDKSGRTPLHTIASACPELNEKMAAPLAERDIQAGPETDAAILEALLAAGADVNARESRFSEATPLMEAALMGTPETVRRLLRAGADPNAASKSGETPLLRAVQRNAPDIVEALLDGGADANQGPDGMAPLFLAVTGGNKAVARLLRQHGARLPLGERFAAGATAFLMKHPGIIKAIGHRVQQRNGTNSHPPPMGGPTNDDH